MDRLKLVLLFGGQSEEHDISCLSADTVYRHLDKERYEVTLVGITKKGRWLLVEDPSLVKEGGWEKSPVSAQLLPDATERALVLFYPDGRVEKRPVEMAFPVLHGRFGEDGTIQGLFELAQIPYVGCGVTASAVGMDKLYTKVLVEAIGVAQARHVSFEKKEFADMERAVGKLEEALSYPVFVKPSDGGSSQGVSRVEERAGLAEAFALAGRYGTRVMAEEAIDGRELECAVLSTPDGIRASGVGEILSADIFYDYEAKYTNPESQTLTAPVLPEDKKEEIRRNAVAIFRAVGARGLSRVDFFLEKKSGRVVFNEINTFPGFTSISMYPQLWEAAGIPLPQLLNMMIEDGLKR